MGQLGDSGRARVSDLYGPVCVCDSCVQQGRCRDYNLHAYESVKAWLQGRGDTCSEFQPATFRGIEGVRP